MALTNMADVQSNVVRIKPSTLLGKRCNIHHTYIIHIHIITHQLLLFYYSQMFVQVDAHMRHTVIQTSSTVKLSPANRLIIRPVGVVSKNLQTQRLQTIGSVLS